MSDIALPLERITGMIYLIRGIKVMLDRDLADLYGVETRALKQAVRRNDKRFPSDFMFELNQEEFQNWRSQIVMSKEDRMGLRYAPMAFTEQGVAMLSSVLKSDRAIQVNIQIRSEITTSRDSVVNVGRRSQGRMLRKRPLTGRNPNWIFESPKDQRYALQSLYILVNLASHGGLVQHRFIHHPAVACFNF
jgi:hypothetical protein